MRVATATVIVATYLQFPYNRPERSPDRIRTRAMKPIKIGSELAIRYGNPNQPERFDFAVRHLLAAPHAEIISREAGYKRQAFVNPQRHGLKRKPCKFRMGKLP